MKVPKQTKTRAPKGVEKKPTLSKEFAEDFEKCYATILDKITNKWIHDEDSANDYYAVCERQVKEFGSIKMLYQPGKKDGHWVEEAHILLIFSTPIRKVEKDAIKKITAKLDNILVRDFVSFREDCKGKWFEEYDVLSVEKILHITKPLAEYKKNTWKMTFEPLDDIHGCGSRGWIPKNIQKVLGTYDESEYEYIKEYILECS